MRRSSGRGGSQHGLSADPDWYKDAVIYELRVPSFFDSNNDGVGDFVGLRDKLGYLSDLGVTTLWLLPFYPSPLRDDGYDISDYTNVHADMGTLDDFRHFLDEAHLRGMRVITELVLNHTSDHHPWFERARRAARGTPEREFYVWSPTPTPYREARIIFKDFESSNWTWDPVAEEYYWHRFYSHQPDLNFESLVVQEALLGVVDFWLGLGVDGMRLDAVPYLYEEDGTTCENLPSTHAFLRRLRSHIDERFPNRMLLAEANQWPEDAATYFGKGDECHMNFHFPIMPRMFMAIHMEDSFPIVDILAQTPTPPADCQWALFLRNHDELTLEMVTEDERDYMYRAYASDSAARINLGIRRRLAPLVGNDRRKVELLNGLLFSLPGTPVLYYGDEIGMGDNIFLGDRDGVRTPMQWSMDRNAGFSRAHTQRLILPVNTDSEYHYEALNVETQQNNPSSLLWWTKRLIAIRREFRAFGRGSFEVLNVSNPRALAFLRRLDDERLLVVANLSRSVQFVEIDLSSHKGLRPVELFGGAAFPPIGDAPYVMTLGGHSFYWLSLERALGDTPQSVPSVEPSSPLLPVEATELFGHDRSHLEDVLPGFLKTRRWFRPRGRELLRVRVLDTIAWGDDTSLACVIAEADYDEGESETYPLWLNVVSGALLDALDDAAVARTLFGGLVAGRSARGRAGTLAMTARMGPVVTDDQSVPRSVPGAHANAVFQIGDHHVLKMFRRVYDGTSIDLELGRALASQSDVRTARYVGEIEYVLPRAKPVTLGLVEEYVPNAGTAWHQALAELGRYYERVLTKHPGATPPAGPPHLAGIASPCLVPDDIRDLLGSFVDRMVSLGACAAELHRGLASLKGADLQPEPDSPPARRSEYQTLRNLSGAAVRELREALGRLTGDALRDAAIVLELREKILERFEPLLVDQGQAMRIRTHGDFHLEQVLFTGKDFVVLDFDGELDRSYNDRRRRRSPLRDVACMLCSIDNAALVTLREPGTVREADVELLSPWASLWSSWMSAMLLSGYFRGAAGTSLVPQGPEQIMGLLDAFALERTLRDLREELGWGSRPWQDHASQGPRPDARIRHPEGSVRMKNSGMDRRYPVGAEPIPTGGVDFRVWAPRRTRVEVLLDGAEPRAVALEPDGDGYFRGTAAWAAPSTRYWFRLDGERKVPDPGSRAQPDGPHGPSQVVDPRLYAWSDHEWRGIQPRGQVVYEMHVGTFTSAGTWEAAMRELPELARLGITVIEVMPIAEFPGSFGWGYDGVDLFAPTRLYGSPDDARRFVDAAHGVGLGVILDVVYNHLGPDGNYLAEFADTYFTSRHATDWGAALNYDAEGCEGLRALVAANAAYWIDEFHFDGLRLDATQNVYDASEEHILSVVREAVRRAARGRSTWVIGESEPQDAQLLRSIEQGGQGLDALWNDDFHHTARVALTGRAEAYYSDYGGTPQELLSALKRGFLYQGQHYSWQNRARGTPALELAPEKLVTFLENHDQVANSVHGARLSTMTSPRRLRALVAVLLLGPGTPLLFQGEEFASSRPFLFFADHGPGLSELVANGRRDFLFQFPSITARSGSCLAPPHGRSTFESCKLDFAERQSHTEMYALYGDLIGLRKKDGVFGQGTSQRVDGALLSSHAFVVRFFGDAPGNDRLLLVNLGPDHTLHRAPEPLLAPPSGASWSILWSSEDTRYGGDGAPPLDRSGIWHLPGESALALAPMVRT